MDSSSEKSLKQKLLPFIALGLCIAIAYWITQGKPAASKGFSKKPSPLVVETKVLQRENFQQYFNSFGRVQAKQQTDLLPLVSGRIIKTFPVFESGRHFKQGQALLQIDPADYEVELQIALSDLAGAELALAEEEARAEQAERDWQALKKRKPNARINDFALRLPQLKAAQAGLDAAKARVKLAETNLERTTVKASFDGRVDTRLVGVGSVVSNATPLASLFDTSVLEVRLPIANDDLAYLDLTSLSDNAGSDLPTNASITFENSLAVPTEYWQGKLVRSEAALDTQSQQLYVVAQLVDQTAAPRDEQLKQELKIGQYLKAQIKGSTLPQTITIPNSAIYQGSYVYVVEKTANAETLSLQRRDIQVRWRNESISVIQTGLEEGDQLVLTPLGQVTSGTSVKLAADRTPQRIEESPISQQGDAS